MIYTFSKVTSFVSLTLSTTTAIVACWVLYVSLMTDAKGCIGDEKNFQIFKNSLVNCSAIAAITSFLQLVVSSSLLISTEESELWTKLRCWAVLSFGFSTVTILCFIHVSFNQSYLSLDCGHFVYRELKSLHIDKFYFVLIVFSVVHLLEIVLTYVTITYGIYSDKLKNSSYHVFHV